MCIYLLTNILQFPKYLIISDKGLCEYTQVGVIYVSTNQETVGRIEVENSQPLILKSMS